MLDARIWRSKPVIGFRPQLSAILWLFTG